MQTSTVFSAFIYRGNWSSTAAYTAFDVVTLAGILYSCVQANTDVNPSTDSGANWVPGQWPVQLQDGSGNALNSTSGALDVQIQNTSLAVTGTFWQATQPVSAASLPLPSNAAQEAGGNLSAIATAVAAGVPVTGVFWQTTQPVSGSVSISNFPVTQPVSGSVSVSNFPTTLPVTGSVSVSNFPTTQPVSGSVSVSNFPTTQPVSGTVAVSGSVAVTGTFWPTTQPVSGTLAVTQSGTWNIGSITTLPSLPAGTNTIGAVTTVPATSGGLSTAVQQALTSSASVKSSGGQLYGYGVFNPNTSTVYMFWYNTTSVPSIGSTTNLVFEIGIPAGAAANVSFDNGIVFLAGIYVAVSTSATVAVAPSTGVVITSLYK
jgi:hypothetical protein